jgi:hypothetical protein
VVVAADAGTAASVADAKPETNSILRKRLGKPRRFLLFGKRRCVFAKHDLPILNDSTFYLRWADPDDAGTDNAVAIDNRKFQVVPEPSVYVLLGVGILLCGQRFLRCKAV